MKKKLIAVISIAAMLVAMVPSMVFATGGDTVTVETFDELKAALNTDVTNIKLTKPIIVVESIDLQGKTIMPSETYEALYPSFSDEEEKDCNGSILIIDKENVKIENGDISGTDVSKNYRGIYLTKKGKNATISNINFENIWRGIQASHINVLNDANNESLGTININEIKIGTCDIGITGMCPNTTYNIESVQIEVAKSYGVYQNGSHGGNTYNMENVAIISKEHGIYISGSDIVEKQTMVLTDCLVQGETAVEVKFVDTTINGGTYKATGTFSQVDNNNGATTEGVAFATTDNSSKKGITDGKIVIIDGTFIAGKNAPALLNRFENPNEEKTKAEFDIQGGTYNTDISGIADGFVLVKNGDMSGDHGYNDIEISYEDEPCFSAYANEEAAIIDGGAIYKDADGLYYTFLDQGDEQGMVRIAYDIYFYAIDPTGIINDETVLTIPKENDGIEKFLKENGKQITQPSPVDGYKFIGWYAVDPDWDYDIDGDIVKVPSLNYTEKANMTAPITADAEYFAKWEKVSKADAPKTGDESNMMLPIAIALIALAGIATVVATRRKHN